MLNLNRSQKATDTLNRIERQYYACMRELNQYPNLLILSYELDHYLAEYAYFGYVSLTDQPRKFRGMLIVVSPVRDLVIVAYTLKDILDKTS